MKKKNRIGLGTFPLAGVFSKVDKKEAERIIKTFIEKDGYYFDTAPMYGYGEVEKLLGKVLKSIPRRSYSIATKCGFIGIEDKNLTISSKYDDVIKECEKSLKRLKVDFIDLYFVHVPDPETPFSETIKALTKLQKDGKIKEIGVSNVSLEELKEYNKTRKIKYVQNRFSLINKSIDKTFENYFLKHKISLIPYQIIERGQLSDKIVRGIDLRDGDLRYTKPDWKIRRLKVITQWVDSKLKPIAKESGIRTEHLAIAWALHQPYVNFVILGATSTKQLLDNLRANEVKLSGNILREIDKAYKELEKLIKTEYRQGVHIFRGLNEKFY